MRRARGITAEVLRDMALALPGVTEVAHMERRAFRTPRRIFATVPPDEASANLLFDPVLQAAWLEEAPDAFAPVPGGWGRMGYTTVTLARVRLGDLETALAQAHALASERAAPRKRSKGKPGPAAKPRQKRGSSAEPRPRRARAR